MHEIRRRFLIAARCAIFCAFAALYTDSCGWCWLIEVLKVKYLNNIIEQDHRFIKRITRQVKGFKSFASAQATLAGIETAHMIRKGQLAGRGQSAFQQFKALAG